MNTNSHNSVVGYGASHQELRQTEESLRLIASLPAPEGLERRVHEALRSAPQRGRVLAWPAASAHGWMQDWMRSAAAAAIVFVVAGGGWGVYSRVQQGQRAKVIAMPAPAVTSGGFSSAGAMRTPQTLNGPVLTHPEQPKTQKKIPAHAGVTPGANGKTPMQAPPAQVLGRAAASR
ncbi:MAG TPA: hypothetical protein VFB43_22550 [Terracidiphilus sp.]|nr:hypothetical protein [Terracidiphilus sp.]